MLPKIATTAIALPNGAVTARVMPKDAVRTDGSILLTFFEGYSSDSDGVMFPPQHICIKDEANVLTLVNLLHDALALLNNENKSTAVPLPQKD